MYRVLDAQAQALPQVGVILVVTSQMAWSCLSHMNSSQRSSSPYPVPRTPRTHSRSTNSQSQCRPHSDWFSVCLSVSLSLSLSVSRSLCLSVCLSVSLSLSLSLSPSPPTISIGLFDRDNRNGSVKFHASSHGWRWQLSNRYERKFMLSWKPGWICPSEE